MDIEKEQEFPESNNFYASFTNTSKTSIREVFEKNNWTCRKANYTDYELTNSWSKLILEGEQNEPLLNGMVVFNQNNIEVLDKIFSGFATDFLYEFYDNQNALILEKKNGK